jgi:hypothetical protein
MKIKSLLTGAIFLLVLQIGWAENSAFIAEIKDAKTEPQLLQLAGQVAEKSAVSEESELARMLISQRLGEVGTQDSMPWLHEMAETKPTALRLVEGQRSPLYESLYPFDTEAKRSVWQIERRLYRADFADQAMVGDWQGLVETARLGDPNSSRMGAWIDVVGELGGAQCQEALEVLSDQQGGSDAYGMLQGCLSLRANQPLEQAAVEALSDVAALYYLRQIAANHEVDSKVFLESLKAHSGIRSAVVAQLGESSDLSLDEFLTCDGADAAFVLSRDQSVERSEELGDLVLNEEAMMSVRRHAVLALMLQKTDTAREVLSHLCKDERCPVQLQNNIRPWLGEGAGN